MPSIADNTDSAGVMHRVAVKQRAGDDAEQHDRAAALADRALRQRHQRQRSALAVIVGAQQDDDVFQRHHDDQRPQDQREHAEHGLRRGVGRVPLAATTASRSA